MTTTILNSKKGNNKYNFNSYEFINPNYYSTKDNKKNYVDNLIEKAYAAFLPWKNKEKTTTYYIDFSKLNDNKFDYTIIDVTPTALNFEWNKAATALMEYAYYLDNPSYDFMIYNTPVKIHGNYIQVGSEIIPTFTNAKYFSKFNKDTQVNLYNIAVTINMTIAA